MIADSDWCGAGGLDSKHTVQQLQAEGSGCKHVIVHVLYSIFRWYGLWTWTWHIRIRLYSIHNFT